MIPLCVVCGELVTKATLAQRALDLVTNYSSILVGPALPVPKSLMQEETKDDAHMYYQLESMIGCCLWPSVGREQLYHLY